MKNNLMSWNKVVWCLLFLSVGAFVGAFGMSLSALALSGSMFVVGMVLLLYFIGTALSADRIMDVYRSNTTVSSRAADARALNSPAILWGFMGIIAPFAVIAAIRR